MDITVIEERLAYLSKHMDNQLAIMDKSSWDELRYRNANEKFERAYAEYNGIRTTLSVFGYRVVDGDTVCKA